MFVLKSQRTKNDELHYNKVYAYGMLRQGDISDNIVHFYGSWRHGDTYDILLEYVDGGTFAELLESPHPTTYIEKLMFWTSLHRLLEPVCRIHCYVDPDDSSRIVKG
jgi:serine/threonine protein kinase